MEWNTLFQLIHSCTDCNTSLITGIEQLSAHFQEHIFFQSRQSVDCTLFFQQILEDKKPGELCCITDSYIYLRGTTSKRNIHHSRPLSFGKTFAYIYQ